MNESELMMYDAVINALRKSREEYLESDGEQFYAERNLLSSGVRRFKDDPAKQAAYIHALWCLGSLAELPVEMCTLIAVDYAESEPNALH